MTHKQRGLRRRPPGGARRQRQRPDAGRVPSSTLAACLTAGLANIAAARGVNLTEVDVDRRGRHRPARHPRALRRGPQRLPADPGQLQARRAATTAEKLRRSSSSRRTGRRSTTSSPTACRSPSRSTPADLAELTRSSPASDSCAAITGRHRRRPGRPRREPLPHRPRRRARRARARPVAERWRSERWDSLRLLSPNWMTRLPGWSCRPGPHGFMTAPEVVSFFDGYATPSRRRREQSAVECRGPGGRRLPRQTTAGTWPRPTSWSPAAGATGRRCRGGGQLDGPCTS